MRGTRGRILSRVVKPSEESRSRTWIAALVVVVATMALYAPSLRHEFVDYDDQVFLFENPTYKTPTLGGVMAYWREPFRSLYQPIPYTIWGALAAISRRAPQLDPTLFHAANIVAHVCAALGVFGIVRLLVRNSVAACAGALVFALHPLQAEPVNWASSFYTVLSGAFVMTSVWMYLLASRSDAGRRRAVLLFVATIVFVLALLSKPSAIVTPFLLTPLLWLDAGGPSRRLAREMLRLVWWVVISIPIIVIVKHTQTAEYVREAPLWFRPVVGFDTLGFYARKLVWPTRLAIDYGRTPTWLMSSAERYWTWAIPFGVAALLGAAKKWLPCVWYSAGVMILGVWPFAGIQKFEFQNVSTVADRYFYLAMLGPALLVACIVRRWPKTLPFVAAMIVALATVTIRQSHTWSDTDALISRALEVNAKSRIANGLLGYRAAKRGDRAEAAARYASVLELDPTDPMTNYNLANLLLADGKFDQAAARYDTALKRDPSYAQARTNLGIALMRLNRLDEAHDQFIRAVQLAPRSADAHANLGMFYLATGRVAEAGGEFRAALGLDPNNAIAIRGQNQLAR